MAIYHPITFRKKSKYFSSEAVNEMLINFILSQINIMEIIGQLQFYWYAIHKKT